MKRIGLLLLVSLFFGTLSAQVNFRDITLEEAFEAAKKEGKLVFVDCNTPWCTGCKIIDYEFSRAKEFGQLMNNLFVCVTYNMESEYGKTIKKRYNVCVYPTFLFLRPDGSLQQEFTSGSNIETFAERFWKAVNPYTCYANLDARYKAGERNVHFLSTYYECFKSMGWDREMNEVKEELWSRLSDKEKIARFELLFQEGVKEGTKEMEFLVANRDEFRKEHGERKVNRSLISDIVLKVNQVIFNRDTTVTAKQLEQWKQTAKDREVLDENFQFRLDLAKATLAGGSKAILKVCKKNLKNEEKDLMADMLHIYSPQAVEAKEIAAWIELGKELLPYMSTSGFMGRKSDKDQLAEFIKELEEKLKQ